MSVVSKYYIGLCVGISILLFFVHPYPVFTTIEEQEQLQQELKEIEAQIGKLEKELAVTVGEKKTLANKLKQLKAEQQSIALRIQQTALHIESLEGKLETTAEEIEKNQAKSGLLKAELATLVRKMYQRDRELFIVRLVVEGKFSTAFIEARNMEQLSTSIKNLSSEAREIRETLEDQQVRFEDEQKEASELLKLTSIQQSALTGKIGEQSELLKDTQGKEGSYQTLLQENKKRASEIKNRIYELLDVGEQITFGEAVTIAEWVGKQVGVEPSLLLAILTQESNLGKNVGTCNRLGDPPEKSWKVIMKPTRDQEPFKTITTELGKDPDITPVSCPMRNKDGSQLGWGGAMGPAQFIPSTWIGYKDKVSKVTGVSPADPWDIRDAFIASSLLLKANGADGTREGNWKAAMRYFSGGIDPKYSFYGDNVLALADKYKGEMEALK